VVGTRTNAADLRRNPGQLFHRTPFTKLLESPELDDLEVSVGYIPFIIEKNVDLSVPFEPGYRRNSDLLVHGFSFSGLSSTARFRKAEGSV
jgi:hypothetical protein